MEPLQQQRRIHQHHALLNHEYRSARPVDQQSRRSARISSSQQDQDLLARSPDSLNPRLIVIPGNGNSGTDPGNSGGNGGTGGGGGKDHGHGNGNDDGGDGVTPHDGNDPTTGSGDGSDGGAGGTTPTKTHKSDTPTPTPDTTDTPTPTSTKTTKTKTEKPKTTTSTTTSSTSATPFTIVLPSQSTVIAQVTATPDATSSGFSSGSGENDSATSKPSGSNSRTGLVIGVIAGVLVGIALLSVLVGFLVRKFKHKDDDPYENDPFDRVDFQRQSVMLPPDTFSEEDHSAGVHSPEMTEQHQGMSMGSPFLDASPYAAAAAVGGAGAYERNQQLQSAPTQANGGGPRPPSMFARHLDAHSGASSAPPMPNAPQVGGVYAPGEYTNTVVPSLPPIAAGSDAGTSPFMGPGVVMGHANVASPYAHLDRARSAASQYVDLDRSGSGGSSAAGQPSQGQRSQSRQGVLDSMAEEHDGYQQQQSSAYGPSAGQQYNHYDQYHGQQQQHQQHQQHYGQYPQQHAEQDDNDDPYGGVSYH